MTAARSHLRVALRSASIAARDVAQETDDRNESIRLDALADTLDAERRALGEHVPRRRVVGTFAESYSQPEEPMETTRAVFAHPALGAPYRSGGDPLGPGGDSGPG